MAALGKLSVTLETDMARFQSEMTKSAYVTEQAMGKMQKSADTTKAAIYGLGAGMASAFSVSMITGAITKSIDALAKLDDMAQKTGSSVENLSKLGKVATAFGTNFEEVDAAMSKLAKGMNGVDEEGSKVKAALDALGISTKDLKNQDPSKIFVEIAKKLQDFKDGPAKVALGTDAMGKSFANLLPYMNDVAENFDKFIGNSSAATIAASEYQDQLGRLKVKHDELITSITLGLLPPMTDLATAFLDAKKEANDLASTNVTSWADSVALGIARVVDVAKVLPSLFSAIQGSFKVAMNDAETLGRGALNLNPGVRIYKWMNGEDPAKEMQDQYDKRSKDLEAANQKYADLWNKPANAMEQSVLDSQKARAANAGNSQEDAMNAAMMKALTGKGGKATLNYSSPKAGGGAGAVDDPARKQRDLALKQIENSLAAERDAMRFHDDYISELRSQDLIDYKTYDAEMKFSRDANLASAIAAYDKQVAVAKEHQSKTNSQKEKAEDNIKIEEARAKKAKAIQDAGQGEVQATLRQTAAQSELKKSMEDWSRQQTQNLDQMQADVEMMGMSQVEIAKLIAARRIQLDVEEQIRRAKEKGGVSDTDIDSYRKQAADSIARSNAVYDAGDVKSKDPYFNMQQSMKRYGEEATNVGQQIGDAMTNAFHGAEDALVNFAMTGKLSFGDLARSILADLARIQAKNLIASLMGGDGKGALGGGLGGALLKLGTMAGAGGASSATGGMGIMGDVIVPSAAGGFDIPAGSNPMTQLHEKEMVLPKQHADVIRGLASGGSSRGSSGITLNPVYNIQIDSRSDRSSIQADVQRAVANGNAQLVDQLSRAGRI